MRTVNLPLLLSLVLGTALLGGGVYMVHRWQVRKNAVVFLRQAEEFKEKADQARKDGDMERAVGLYDEANRSYQAYFDLRPEDIAAHEARGLMLFEVRQYVGAFVELERVLRQSPDRNDLRRKVVDLAMELGQRAQQHPDATERISQTARWYSVAREHLEEYLLPASRDDAQLLELVGRCHAALGHDEKAVEAYEKCVEINPKQVDAYTRVAGLLRHRMNRGQEADKWIAQMVEANPDDARARLAASQYYRVNGAIDPALEHVEKMLELKPNDREGLILAAQCTMAKAVFLAERRKGVEAREMFDRAREYIKNGVERYPTDPDLHAAAADTESRAGDPQRSVEALRAGLKATNNHPQLLWYAVNLMMDLGQVEEARNMMDRLRATAYPEPLKGYVEARLKFMAGEWRAAIDELDRVRGGMAAFPQFVKQVDFWLGKAYTQLGNADQAIRAYRRALDNDPFYGPALAALVETYIAAGQIDSAMELYRQMAGRFPSSGFLAAARMLLLRNLQLRPNQRNWGPVLEMLDQASKADPKSVALAMVRAEVYTAQNRQALADQILREALDANPGRADLLAALIVSAQRQEAWDKVEMLLKEGEAMGDRVELRLAKARYLARRYGRECLPQLRELAQPPENYAEVERQQLLSGILNVIMVLDEPLARDLCRKLADAQPTNVQVRFLLFELALRAEDNAAVPKLLTEIEAIEGRGPLWHYGEAVRLSLACKAGDDPRLNEALEHLRVAAEARPSWSRIPLLAAGVYDQQGKSDLALENYRKAVERGERNPNAIRRLADLLNQRRLYDEAVQVLAMLEVRPESVAPDLDRLSSKSWVGMGDYDKAATAARKVAAQSKEYQDHLWLGQLLDAQSRRKAVEGSMPEALQVRGEAEAALRKAAELAPGRVEVWVQLVRFLAGGSPREQADAVIAQAAEKLPPEQAPLALAQCYEALGERDKAQAQYDKALAAAPTDPIIIRTVADFYWRIGLTAKAEPLVRQVVSGKIAAQPAEQCWARRLLAVIMVAQGGNVSLRESLDLINQNLKAEPNSTIDQRLRAGILAAMPSQADRKLAREIIEDINRGQKSPLADDMFVLAQLYLADGDWPQYTKMMSRLIGAYPNELRYSAFYVRTLLQRSGEKDDRGNPYLGELRNAEIYLSRLEQLAGNQFAVVQLRADLMVRRGQFAEAQQLLKGFIDKEGVLPVDRNDRLRLVAETFEQFTQRMKEPSQRQTAEEFAKDAEMIYRVYVEANPGTEIAMVGFLVRLGRIDAALETLGKVWEQATPAQIAQSAIEFARVGALPAAQAGRAEAVLKAAMEKHKRAVPLLLVLADLYNSQARYDEAEKLYREMLANDAENAVVMNNLAVLLAMRHQRLDEALRLINRAIELTGPLAQMLDSRASVHIARGEPEKAVKDLEEAIGESPDPVRLFHMAQAQLALGNRTAAVKALRDANRYGLSDDKLQSPERPINEKMQKDLLAPEPAAEPAAAPTTSWRPRGHFALSA